MDDLYYRKILKIYYCDISEYLSQTAKHILSDI